MSNYKDFQQRFDQMEVDKDHLSTKYFFNNQNPEIINRIKMALAGAFIDNYIKCKYQYDDPVHRQKLINKLGKNPLKAFEIPQINGCVGTNDIKKLLAPIKGQGI